MKLRLALLTCISLFAASSAMSAVTTLTTPISGTINFDGTGAPCSFSGTTQLTTRYASNGVTFSNNFGASKGGAILNQCGGFGFNGHSGTDFLAYNTSSTAEDVITMAFGSTMGTVSIWAADYYGGASLLMQAFDATNTMVGSASVTGSRTWQQMTVTGSAITSVVLRGGRIGGFDDLSFTGASSTPSNPSGDIPEPGVLALVGLGLVGVAASRRRAA